MATDCPVCGGEAEHVRRERPRDETLETDSLSPVSGTTIEVDELCAIADERWDRICHSARVQDTGDAAVPILGVYYHHFGEAGD